MNIVCIIQARMGSTRLPGKVLKPLLDKTVLDWGVYRVQRSRLIDQVVIATTTNPGDKQLVDVCEQRGWAYHWGSEDDVLDRYYQAAKAYDADVVIRITSDCPMIDPGVLDNVIASFFAVAPQPDYASNFVTRTYPRGLDTEIFTFAALEKAWQQDHSSWREHVTPYIYRHPETFTLHSVTNPTDYSHYRWTVDTPEDYELITRIFEDFGHGGFSWQEALQAMKDHPDWAAINRDIEQKKL